MASEPDIPLWAGFSNNEIPVNLGKLLTGQDFDGDAKKCMDAVAELIDKQVADAGLL
jgi:multiple sugar transport system substrate-binding protein